MKKKVANWGNYPTIEAEFSGARFTDDLKQAVGGTFRGIARGNGRCYGDASLSSQIISLTGFERILQFDDATGIFRCQAGLTLDKILEFIVPKGWFLPVTPGTKFITVGGALASDVHGKNHHSEGTFADHVISFGLILANGEEIEVSRESNPGLFYATAGGMGLTGIITEVGFRLKKIETSYITQKKLKARNLSEAMDLFDQHVDHTYSMAWIDCLRSGNKIGRSLLMLGEHSRLEELKGSKRKQPLTTGNKGKLTMPFYLPAFTLNALSIRSFNLLYYHKELRKEANGIIHYDPFFYPLDAILHWNRMYGKPGFLQYQFVLPLESSKEGLEVILNEINKKGMGSFLAVLKLFGEENDGYLSFPRKGYTLALDFPVRKRLFPFLDELDKIVKDYGGRIYLSKDARMKENMFLDTYPRVEQFFEIVKKYNPGKFQSLQSDRLMTKIRNER